MNHTDPNGAENLVQCKACRGWYIDLWDHWEMYPGHEPHSDLGSGMDEEHDMGLRDLTDPFDPYGI